MSPAISGVIAGLVAGMRAGGWAIGFLAVVGGFTIALISLWAVCYRIGECFDRKKEEKTDVFVDD